MSLLRLLTFLLGSLTVTTSSDPSICFAMAFYPLGNSDHVVTVFIDFL